MDQGEGDRGRARSSATRSTSRCGRRRSRARTPPGTRPGAAAGRAGTSSARRWRRSSSASTSTSTAAAPTSSSRTTRTRSRRPRPARGRAARAPLDAQRDGPARASEKMAKSVGNICLLHEALDRARPRRADRLLLRRPLPPADRLLARSALERGGAQRRADPRRRARGSTPGGSPADAGAAARGVLRRARRRLQHAESARARVRVGARGEPPQRGRRAGRRRRPARDARRARRSTRCSTPTRRPTAGCGGAGAAGASARRRAPRATSPRPTACATSCAALGWEVRDTPRAGPTLRPARAVVILYGRNAVREALRGPRGGAAGLGDRAGRARAVAARARRCARRARRSSSAAAARRDHQGVCAEVERVPLRRRRRRCWPRRRRADRRARRGPGPAEPRRDLPHGRVRRRDGRRDPGAAQRRGHAGRLQGLGRRGRAPGDRARAQPRRLPAATRAEPGAWVYGADGDARVGYAQPDYRGKVVLVLGSEGSGLRPRVARSCDELVALPLRGPDRVAQRQRRRGRAAVRDRAPALSGVMSPRQRRSCRCTRTCSSRLTRGP